MDLQQSQSFFPPTHSISRISVEDFAKLDLSNDDVVLDLGQAQTYVRGHLPGAVHLPISRIVRQEGYASGLAPTSQALSQLAMDFGLLTDGTVYVYDDEGGGWAGRMVWILDMLNVQRICYIDGGLRAWLAKGLPFESQRTLQKSSLKAPTLNYWPNIELEELQDLVTTNIQLLDARSVLEYQGVRRFAQQSGHIPGAVNYDWVKGMDQAQGSVIRDLDQIRAEFLALGLNTDKTTITYCQTHHRSGFTYLLCRLLNIPVRAYAGSWSEWGNVPIGSKDHD